LAGGLSRPRRWDVCHQKGSQGLPGNLKPVKHQASRVIYQIGGEEQNCEHYQQGKDSRVDLIGTEIIFPILSSSLEELEGL